MFGGFDGDADLGDLWVYHWAGPLGWRAACRTAPELLEGKAFLQEKHVKRPERRETEVDLSLHHDGVSI